MKYILFIAFVLFFKPFAYSQKITDGSWYNEEKTGKIKFFENNGKLYGKIVWLKEPNENGKPKVDSENPDSKLRSRSIMGLVFLKGFVKNGENKWEDGTIYDPTTGKTYSCYMELASKNLLNIRGYIGISLIGRTSKFTRAD